MWYQNCWRLKIQWLYTWAPSIQVRPELKQSHIEQLQAKLEPKCSECLILSLSLVRHMRILSFDFPGQVIPVHSLIYAFNDNCVAILHLLAVYCLQILWAFKTLFHPFHYVYSAHCTSKRMIFICRCLFVTNKWLRLYTLFWFDSITLVMLIYKYDPILVVCLFERSTGDIGETQKMESSESVCNQKKLFI